MEQQTADEVCPCGDEHTFEKESVSVVTAGDGGFEVEGDCVDCGDELYTFVATDEMVCL